MRLTEAMRGVVCNIQRQERFKTKADKYRTSFKLQTFYWLLIHTATMQGK